MSKRLENLRKSVEPEKLASRLRAWLQPYRLVVTDELVSEYADVLAELTEDDLDTALNMAARENSSNYAPSPGCVLEIATELIRGREHPVLAEMAEWEKEDMTPEELRELVASPEWQELKASVKKK